MYVIGCIESVRFSLCSWERARESSSGKRAAQKQKALNSVK